MTVKMSSEGDSSKNLSSESNEKSEAENTDSSQDVKDAKTDAPTENSVEKKEDDAKPKDASKEASEESDKKPDSSKATPDKAENAKSDVAASDKKEDKTKAKDEDEEENSDQDEESSDKGGKDGKEVPLLDQPLEKSGKRERKNVQRFNEDFPEPKEVEIPSGPGTSLGNIPRIDASISRFKNDDMKLLHKILFRTPGKSTMIKKNIKKFSGFDFKKDSEEYTKKISSVQKCEVKQLKSICEMLDLQKTGNKDDIVERIIDFLLEPKDSGKPVGGGRPKRTAAVRANNRGYSSHDNYSSDERHSGRSGRDKGRRSNLKDDSSSASDEDFEPSDEGSDEKPRVTKRKRVDRKKLESDDEDASEMETASSEDSDFQDEPKSKRKKAVKANNKNKGKGTGKRGRKPAPTKKPAKGGKKKKESSEEEEEEEEESEQKGGASSSSEDEPLVKKAAKTAQPPTDDEIKSYVKEILEGANLEQITMKTVCQQVYAHYPDFDLTHKKDFIKSTVKSLIST